MKLRRKLMLGISIFSLTMFMAYAIVLNITVNQQGRPFLAIAGALVFLVGIFLLLDYRKIMRLEMLCREVQDIVGGAHHGQRLTVTVESCYEISIVSRGINSLLDRLEEINRTMLESEEKYRNLVELSNDGITIVQEGIVKYGNRRFVEMVGLPLSEIVGSPVSSILKAEDATSLRDYFGLEFYPRTPITLTDSFVGKSQIKIHLLLKRKVIKYLGKPAVLMVISDISEQKAAEKALHNQVRYENIVRQISSGFVNLPGTRLNEAIERSLYLSGKFFGADRAYLFQFSDDGKTMDNTHEWCIDGVESYQSSLKNIPVDSFPWWIDQIRKQEHILIKDVESLPPEAKMEKKEFQKQNIRSLLSLPLIVGGELVGFLGMDSVQIKKSWTDEQIAQFKVIVEILANALLKHRAEESLKASEERYRGILASIEDGYYEVDLKGRITNCNESASRLLGYTMTEFIGMSYRQYFKEPEKVYRGYNKVYTTGKANRGLTMEAVKKNGDVVHVELSIVPIKEKDNSIIGFRGVSRDITERIMFEEKLKYLSLHDQLTGLNNRAYFQNEMDRLNESREHPISIIIVDIDNLKQTNDTYGHSRGDRLIKDCAKVLKKSLRRSDILARVGGDEFAVILPRTGQERAQMIVNRIRSRLDLHNSEEGQMKFDISIGFATAEDNSVPLEETHKKADIFMYRDKMNGEGNYKHGAMAAVAASLGERYLKNDDSARLQEELCRKLGQRIGLTSRQLSNLTLLPYVADVWKVDIPDEIIFKPGPLTAKEWEVIKRHPEKGYHIAKSSNVLSGIAELILKHHEWWDGSGYPLGLKGEDIPLECRIMAIVNAYNAMTNDRPYRRARSKEEAFAELWRCAGSQFDPELVKGFISVLESEATGLKE